MNGTAHLEREGDELRADMDRTLGQIERELSPRRLMDRSMEYMRDHGSDFVREAGETVRRHPVPILLTAAGLVWLTAAVASSRSSARQSWDERQRWNGNGEGSHLDQDMSSYDDFAAGHGYAQSSESSGASISSGASNLASRASSQLSKAESHLTNLVREQPLALGALALAAGALLGAALPITDYENRMMGPSRMGSSQRGSSPRADGDDSTMMDE